jgi:hypothetical protein
MVRGWGKDARAYRIMQRKMKTVEPTRTNGCFRSDRFKREKLLLRLISYTSHVSKQWLNLMSRDEIHIYMYLPTDSLIVALPQRLYFVMRSLYQTMGLVILPNFFILS